MCIFFFVIGDAMHPTILCNNRDEYFARVTARGAFYQDNNRTKVDLERFPLNENHIHYVPYDLEAGGTWLSFDSLHDSERLGIRFAVVLNLDNNSVPTSLPLNQLRSRGELVRDFLSLDPHSRTAAETYANEMYSQRNQYRPFNLIICDGFGKAYYITSSIFQNDGPELLQTGRLFGISNGYLHDPNWQKVALGKELLTNLVDSEYFLSIFNDEILSQLVDRQAACREDHGSVAFHSFPNSGINPLCVSGQNDHRFGKNSIYRLSLPPFLNSCPRLQQFIQSMYDVMTNTHPCADHEYGYNYPPLVNLASIMASPIRIDASVSLQQELVPSYSVPGLTYRARNSQREKTGTAQSHGGTWSSVTVTDNMTARTLEMHSSEEACEGKEIVTSQLVPLAVNVRYQLIEEEDIPWFTTSSSVDNTAIDPSTSLDDAKQRKFRQIFGTRTVTLLTHVSPSFVRHHAAALCSSPTGGKTPQGYFVLLEDDIQLAPQPPDALYQTHDIHCFNNVSS
jgi:uncharacterized protein with NRDE domain